jgi:hypothetical protein
MGALRRRGGEKRSVSRFKKYYSTTFENRVGLSEFFSIGKSTVYEFFTKNFCANACAKERREAMPTPRRDESYEDWMARCIPVLIDEGRDRDQAVAICASMWEDREKKESAFKGVIFGKHQ